MENCCSPECLSVTHLPLSEQVILRSGKQVGNKVFRKGKSEKLTYKHSGVLSDTPLAKAQESSDIRHKINPKQREKKALLGKISHYYVKAQVGLFELANEELHSGDTLLISGPTTGNETIVLTKMTVNGQENTVAKPGDKLTFEAPFRLRLSDKVYKILPQDLN